MIQFNEGRRESTKKALDVGETRSLLRSLHGNDLNSARLKEIVARGEGREMGYAKSVADYEVEL